MLDDLSNDEGFPGCTTFGMPFGRRIARPSGFSFKGLSFAETRSIAAVTMPSMLAYNKLRSGQIFCVVVSLLVFNTRSVLAVTDAQKAKEKEARKACLVRDLEKGISLLVELYTDTNEVLYLYNQARCYQQNDRPELALSSFHEYLRKEPKMPPDEMAILEKHMADCEAIIAKKAGSPAPPPSISQPVHAEPLQAPSPSQVLVTSPESSSPIEGRGFRVAGVITGTVGLCTLGGAVVLNVLQRKQETTLQGGDLYTESKGARSSQYKTLAITGYAIGSTAVITGIVLYLIGSRSGANKTPSIALIPNWFSGEATLNLHGAF